MAGIAYSLCATATLLLAGCVAGDGSGRSVGPESYAMVGDGAREVATLGDSITAGTPLWDPDPDVRRDIQDPDPRSQWQYWAAKANGGLSFRNCGINGERTDQIERRLEDCLGAADVLVVQGGINDLAQGYDVDHAAGALRRMVRAGKSAGATVLLAEVLPWNAGYPDHDAKIRQLNGRIRDIGRSEHVDVLPFYSTLEDPDRPGRMAPRWTIDGSHPSIEGHRRLGERAFAVPGSSLSVSASSRSGSESRSTSGSTSTSTSSSSSSN